MDLDELLEKYMEAKEQIKKYENRIEKYKHAIDKQLVKQNTDCLIGSKYKVQRRNNTRLFVSKNNLPQEIFDKYATRTTFYSYYVNNVKRN